MAKKAGVREFGRLPFFAALYGLGHQIDGGSTSGISRKLKEVEDG